MSVSKPFYSAVLILGALARVASPQEAEEKLLSAEQLEQLASPVALYPDDLLSQIFIASTYPLEVVEAARWLKENEGSKGDTVVKAVEGQSWDASVKSLVNVPSVLTMLDERLSWTQQLGNAVLSQEKELMDAVQRLRARAQSEGNLETTPEQKVIVEEKVIRVESVRTEVIYVPTYNPVVVYGAWPYPTYPPPKPYYPPGYVAGAAAVGFMAGVACTALWGYAWGGCNWRGGDIDIDVDRNAKFNNSNNINIDRNNAKKDGKGKGAWKHDPGHRKGVGYADRKTANRFDRGGDSQRREARESFRGRTGTSRPGTSRPSTSRPSTSRPSTSRPSTSRPSTSRPSTNRPSTGSRQRTPSRGRSGGGFSGFEGRSSTRSHSSRGRSSRGGGGRGRGGRR